MAEKDTTSTALVPLDNPDQVALALSDLENEIELADTSAVQAAIIRRIVLSQTIEEALSEVAPVSMSDAIGGEFLINGGAIMRSTFGSGKGAYFSCDAVDLVTGEAIILNTSGKVAGRLWVIQRLGGLPIKVRIKTLRGGPAVQGNPCDIEVLS